MQEVEKRRRTSRALQKQTIDTVIDCHVLQCQCVQSCRAAICLYFIHPILVIIHQLNKIFAVYFKLFLKRLFLILIFNIIKILTSILNHVFVQNWIEIIWQLIICY